MSPFYTRTGDDGTTGMLGESRLPKYHPRMEALGAIDEASAALGLARSICCGSQTATIILHIQRDLSALMAEIATTPENAERFRAIEQSHLEWLETKVEAIAGHTSIPNDFILPGDSQAGAAISLARTIIRRAERRVAELFHNNEIKNPHLLQYLNRLSSLCFILELEENQAARRTTSQVKNGRK